MIPRRRVVQGAAALTGLAALGAGAGLLAVQPRRDRWPAFGAGARDAPEVPRRVVIVGGGVAGMAAAAALGARGYRVTLVERADRLGGKLTGWPLRVLGEDVPMEHGFHGFFRQYYNLRALLAEAGADRDLRPLDAYAIRMRDRPTEAFGAGVAPFPLDLLEVLARSPSLGLGDVAGDRPGMRELLAYDPVRTFARYDGVDVETFVRETGLEGGFSELVLRPFGQASMNALTGLSAAEAVRFFHFYMLGNPEGLGFDALGRGVHLAVLDPIREHLVRLGVEIRTGATVQAVRLSQGRAVGVVLAGGGEAAFDVPVSAVPERGWAAAAGGRAFVRRTGADPPGTGTFEARDARCTHMACPVGLVAGGFLCPCHAGRYDEDGVPVAGPPPRPLAALPVTVVGDRLVLGAGAGEAEVVPADVVILATEIRGLQRLARDSALAEHAPALAASIGSLQEADPYAVVRLWFDRPTDPAHPAFYTVAGWPWTDSLALYSSFQAPYVDWAARTGGSVVETHAYAIPPDAFGDGDPERIARALDAELREALPELRDAKALHVEAMAQSNFTAFPPGAFSRRPTVTTEIPNLFVAGDHVQLPFPAFLMEAAAASGRLAANAICAADGVREVEIPTVALRGPLADVLS